MKSESRFLIVILVILTASVVLTGGLAIYLTLARERERSAPAQAPSAEQPGDMVQSTGVITGESRIAFVSNRESESAVYTMDGYGLNVQRVSTPDMTFCAFPSWSPDGTRLAYVGTTGDLFANDDAEVQVWVSAANGSEHIQVSHAISNVAFAQPSWSPDGTRLAFQSRSEPEGGGDPTSIINIVRASDGESERNLAFPSEIQHLAWSPVEDRLVVVSGDPDAGTLVHVMYSDGSEIAEAFRGTLTADWSSDGESIVVGDYASQGIVIVDLSRDQETRTVAQTIMQPIEVAWSSDGAHVAAANAGHYRQGYATVMQVVTVETGEVATIAEGSGWVGWPHWSSDGQSLLFTWGHLNRGPGLPRAALWVYDVESGESLQLTSDESFNGLGVWSP